MVESNWVEKIIDTILKQNTTLYGINPKVKKINVGFTNTIYHINCWKDNMMERKIVAIGGGKNGRLKSDGTREPYETEIFDKEIIRLTGKQHPNFLFLGHSQPEPESETGYFITTKNIIDT